MTQEEKLEEAKRLYETANADQRYVLESLFPELKESEDERIRKTLVAVVNLYYGKGEDEEKTACLAWLEKQGEQKPKFRIGDTIKKKSTGDIVTVSEVDLKNREYRLSNTGFIPFKYEYLWELVEQKPVFEMITPEESLGIDSDTYNKIVDECVYGEQKSAWSEEDELNIRELESIVKQVWATAEHGNDKDTIHKMSNLSFFLKTLKPQLKQEWSKEDEILLKLSLENLTELKDRFGEYYGRVGGCIDWLKSLKDRVQPQNRWKPSDEQIEALAEALSLAKNCGEEYAFDLRTLLDDLKRLLKI